MKIPYWKLSVALLMSGALILAEAQFALFQIIYAQATACPVVATSAEPAKIAITVTYVPGPGAYPPEQGVLIERNDNDAGWKPLVTLPPNTRSFVDNSLQQGTKDNNYRFRSAVFNADGQSPWSEEGCKTIRRQLRPPPAPTLVVS